MPLTQATRPLAKRIDGGYVVRRHPGRTWRRGLTWGAALVALGWFAWQGASYDGNAGRARLDGTIANPGPVSSAHANFEHDCATCHRGDEGERFLRGVTDAACLGCHDGAIHHANQKVAPDARGVSRASHTLALADPAHPHGARAAACATCHVEHRGRPALAATSDAHCTTCHADLPRAARVPPHAGASVTAFDESNHPGFGRSLRSGEGRWIDPTRLKFNHAAHQVHVKPPAGAAQNCAACHQTGRATDVGDGRYVQAVAYARHCASCHPLDVAGDVTVAHEDLALVRAQLADVEGTYRSRLATMTPDARDKALTRESPGRRGSRRSGGAAGEKISADEWVKQQTVKLGAEVASWFDRERDLPGYAAVRAAATQPVASGGIDAKSLEYFTVFGAANRCALCHEIDAAGPMLATVPTGLPDAPRRWFTSSRFDHDAHRNVACTDCHAGGVTSAATSDVLLPDLTTRGATSGQSCADCHRAGTSSVRTAPSGCVTCHLYHDRTLERPPGGAGLSTATP